MDFVDLVSLKVLEAKARMGASESPITRRFGVDGLDSLPVKNLCFRVDPVTQARLEAACALLRLSKQQLLVEVLWDRLDALDASLLAAGLPPVDYVQRLRELGYSLTLQPGQPGRLDALE